MLDGDPADLRVPAGARDLGADRAQPEAARQGHLGDEEEDQRREESAARQGDQQADGRAAVVQQGNRERLADAARDEPAERGAAQRADGADPDPEHPPRRDHQRPQHECVEGEGQQAQQDVHAAEQTTRAGPDGSCGGGTGLPRGRELLSAVARAARGLLT
ncbi:hypothetical protein Amsp01_080280 [Amycolatopsis sp. NBRC 101858]|nr:hypothetical protein Amsp01_080280 [Amycolatopsis sp. NBRC 101858]